MIVTPSDDVNGRSISTPARPRSGIAARRTQARLTRRATTRPTSPNAAHALCRLNRRYGLLPRFDSVAADADSTITSPSITNRATTIAMT